MLGLSWQRDQVIWPLEDVPFLYRHPLCDVPEDAASLRMPVLLASCSSAVQFR